MSHLTFSAVIKRVLFSIVCIFFTIYGPLAQNAPVTILPVKAACPGSVVSVPVTVTAFSSIGSLSLTMNYNPAVLTYVSSVNSSGFPGMFFGGATAGKVVIGGYSSSSGITLPDNTVLFTVNFNYLGGTTALTWFDNGHSCEYAGYPGYPTLNDIPFSTYYTNGQVGPDMVVDFNANNLFPEVNQTVAFNDMTTGGPTGWNWSFTPGSYVFVNGTSAASQNPQVQFTSNGAYQATLAAAKGPCIISVTKPAYIHAGIKGLWTGITSGDWNIQSNWHNYTVPQGTTDVVIPASSSNWPVFSGDMTLGSQCNSLVLEGTASRLTITGNLFIP
jgi:PKD repeat protein